MLVKVSLFNLQGARSIRGTGVILAPTRPFINTFFHFFQIIFKKLKIKVQLNRLRKFSALLVNLEVHSYYRLR